LLSLDLVYYLAGGSEIIIMETASIGITQQIQRENRTHWSTATYELDSTT